MSTSETDTFLTQTGPRSENVVLPQYVDQKGRAKQRTCCGCSCCKCCCIWFVIIVVIVAALLAGAYFYMRSKMDGGVSSENSAEWKAKLAGNASDEPFTRDMIAGSYELVSYDDTFRNYLETFSVPSFVISMVLSMNEEIVFTVPEEEDGEWTIRRITAIKEFSSSFKLGMEFESPWGRDQGIMHKTCTQPAPNRLVCAMEERVKGWELDSDMVFSSAGMVDTRTFYTENVSTRKYYQKIVEDGTKREKPQLGEADGENPFSEDLDDAWGDDSEDDW